MQERSRHVGSTETWMRTWIPPPARCTTATVPGITNGHKPHRRRTFDSNPANFSSYRSGPTAALRNAVTLQLLDMIPPWCLHICSVWFGLFFCRSLTRLSAIRLFQMLANQKQLAAVHTALLGRVCPSCFLWQNCTAGKM